MKPDRSKEHLLNVLKDAGKPAQVITAANDSSIVVLPYGGRILGLFTPNHPQNILWTNPALQTVETAQTFFQSSDWQNSGGDRTWLVPELDFFFPDYPDTTTYNQPRQLDPGNYNVLKTHDSLALHNKFTVVSGRGKKKMPLELTKTIRPAGNPLRYLQSSQIPQLDYAGYELKTTFELKGKPNESDFVGIWNLLQLPNGGEMFIPTYSRTEPTVFFGDIPAGHLVVEENMIRYRMKASGEQKFSVPALTTTGRIGYTYTSGLEHILVVRNFSVNPSGDYVDVWHTKPDDMGYAVQACNINSKWGSFSELEYHAPAIGGTSGLNRYEDISQVWAFCGTAPQISKMAQLLISPKV